MNVKKKVSIQKEKIFLTFRRKHIYNKSMKNYGEEIKKYREMKGISRDQLAELSGITRRTIQNVENGNDCSVRTLLKLAGALEVSPAILLP